MNRTPLTPLLDFDPATAPDAVEYCDTWDRRTGKPIHRWINHTHTVRVLRAKAVA